MIDVYAKKNLVDGYYPVQRGENLYFIAWRLDMDYRDLADFNHITAPYILPQGPLHSFAVQKLRLTRSITQARLGQRAREKLRQKPP